MTPQRLQRIERVYHSVLAREEDQRAAFLEEACAGDEALRQEVESLLAHQQKAQKLLESLPWNVSKARSHSTSTLEGRQIGPYRILSLLGAGGMGEVYRAHDSQLKREVALKILPEEFSRDPDRVARFHREAEVLASLNHPNIAAIYDMVQAEGLHVLVLEFVEGETLAERIGRGPIPVEEALDLARNICEALEVAHERGITHRDLKPANIKLTPDGKVKVLDFGLARLAAMEPSPPPSEWPLPKGGAPNSPTMLSMLVTREGLILGTAAYMAPEQAKGKTVDRRADIWAFGVVLYEMLTGRIPFSGETASEIMAAVIMKDPDWSLLPENVPERVRDLLRRCVVKEPRIRVRDIGDVRIAIEEVQTGTEVDGEVSQMPTRRRSKIWTGTFAVLLVTTLLSLGALSVLYFNRTAPLEIRVDVNTPPTGDPFSFAISPDGRRLVFSAYNAGKSQLWVRPLDSLAAQPLAGTDGGTNPFWSPDSMSVGFFADRKLKRVDIVGGAPQELANGGAGLGGAWNREGTIVFAASPVGRILKVPATGGEAVPVTQFENGQTGHRFPQFLPDGRHFVYFVPGGPAQGVYVGSLDGGPSRRLTNTDAAAVVSPSGFLLFMRQTTLFAQAFDLSKQELSGNPFPVAEQATRAPAPGGTFDAATRAVGFSANSDIVAYRTASTAGARQLTWLDRSGKLVGTIGAPDVAGLSDVELSPDGKRVAVVRTVNSNTDIWLIDAVQGGSTRITFDAALDQRPIWSPDGRRLVFNSNRKRLADLYWKLSSGAGADELLLESDRNKAPNDWSSDGRFLMFSSIDPPTGWDLWVLPVSGDKKPFPFLQTPFEDVEGQFSPDGKWVAFQSNESGRYEIYLQPFPGPGGKFQISTGGGAQPRWNKNGKEIFYISLDGKMMATAVKLSPDGQSLEPGTPVALFPVRIAGGPLSFAARQQYAVSNDGQRFLVNNVADETAAPPITLIYHWKPQAAK